MPLSYSEKNVNVSNCHCGLCRIALCMSVKDMNRKNVSNEMGCYVVFRYIFRHLCEHGLCLCSVTSNTDGFRSALLGVLLTFSVDVLCLRQPDHQKLRNKCDTNNAGLCAIFTIKWHDNNCFQMMAFRSPTSFICVPSVEHIHGSPGASIINSFLTWSHQERIVTWWQKEINVAGS